MTNSKFNKIHFFSTGKKKQISVEENVITYRILHPHFDLKLNGNERKDSFILQKSFVLNDIITWKKNF